jgi:hypothetical protein
LYFSNPTTKDIQMLIVNIQIFIVSHLKVLVVRDSKLDVAKICYIFKHSIKVIYELTNKLCSINIKNI